MHLRHFEGRSFRGWLLHCRFFRGWLLHSYPRRLHLPRPCFHQPGQLAEERLHQPHQLPQRRLHQADESRQRGLHLAHELREQDRLWRHPDEIAKVLRAQNAAVHEAAS